jgi:site-specific DNA-methyltransferase (adenine-specific)
MLTNVAMLTTKEAAEYLGVSLATVYRMEKRGLITAVKTPGGQRRFSLPTLQNYLKNSPSITAPQNPSKYKAKAALQEEGAAYQVQQQIEPYFALADLKIYQAEFLQADCVEPNSIDLIITSPPYNVDIAYSSFDDTISYQQYLDFTKAWLSKCYLLLKADGRFCLNIPLDKNKGGQQSIYADITTIAKETGFKYHSTIIWNEQNISRRTAWGSWLSAAAPYVIAPVEMIVVLYKHQWKKTSGSKKSDITKEEFMQWTNGVWSFSGESKKRVGHPAPFPVELPRRCIKLFSFVGDVVLDPFLGSGSTLLACLQTNRKGIGIEIDPSYCQLAKERLLTEGQINQLKLSLS